MAKRRKVDDFIIREATEKDLPVLVEFLVKLALHVSGGEERALKEEERKRLRESLASCLHAENKLVVVAETRQRQLVGMGDIHVISNQGVWEQAMDGEFRYGVIDDIWVEPEFRKHGIFKAIFNQLLEYAESSGAFELILEYSVDNKEADATWRRLGFKPTGIRAAAFTKTVKDALSKGKKEPG